MYLNTRKFLAFTVLIFISVSSFSQKTDELICAPIKAARDTLYLKRQSEVNKTIKDFIARQNLVDDDRVYTLPVVVHVIHTGTPIGSADNPTDGNIAAMIQLLNNAWRKNGSFYGGVDMKIQFQLATRDPNCNATNGIVRINAGGIPNYVANGITSDGWPGSVDDLSIKNLSRWSNTDYINIWVVNKINGSNSSPGGYAYPTALYNNAALDGIVINALYANANNHRITHEMGHMFELFHTFENTVNPSECAAPNPCEETGDLVCDTEPSKQESNCGNTFNSCTGTNYAVADNAFGYTILNNYMNYSLSCAAMFTAGQKARVRAGLLLFRSGLISSLGLSTPATNFAGGACVPFANNGLSSAYGVQLVEFNTLRVYSSSSGLEWSNYVDRTNNQRTNVYAGTNYNLTVVGSYFNLHTMKAYIDFNNDGDFDDAGETILTALTDSVTTSVTIPTNAVTGVPLRMRVVADNPGLAPPFTYPTACQLFGTGSFGSGQAEDYAIIIGPTIQSITTGAWNNPSTWNCNCVPTTGAQILIRNGHTVSITQAMGLIQFSNLVVESGGNLSVGNNATVQQVK